MSNKASFETSSELIDDSDDYVDYRFESMRLDSFAKWKVDHKFRHKLASAGFYSTRKGDQVKCFDCDVTFLAAEMYEDLSAKHRRCSPKCRFVRGSPSAGNVPIGIDWTTVPKRVPKMKEICNVDKSYLHLDMNIEIYFENAEVCALVNIGDLVEAKHPEFVSYEIRLLSFESWPKTMTQKKEDLATAGFVYGNDGNDRAYCFFCGGGVMKWAPQEKPVQEHIKWYPTCKFIKRLLAERQSRELEGL